MMAFLQKPKRPDSYCREKGILLNIRIYRVFSITRSYAALFHFLLAIRRVSVFNQPP
jgi:hypothetical protein